jgi:LAS superfamily LD-carboxypeptidase LdcB
MSLDCATQNMAQLQSLDPAELTGRTRTHVVNLEEPRCILHRAVVGPFTAMRRAAVAAGIELLPASSFRDFAQQLAIWNDKFRGQRPLLNAAGVALDPSTMAPGEIVDAILCWSALPGASRHHWGTDIDVIDARALPSGVRARLVPEEFASGGMFEKLDRWLTSHAAAYGFYRPYDRDRGGVKPEPWHLSYAPVSNLALRALTLELLERTLADADLDGRDVVSARLPAIYQRYVLAVAPPSKRALAAVSPTTPSSGSPPSGRARA